MSGFHPILGLLAVAVCISFAKGESLSLILNGQASTYKLHELNSHRLTAEQHKSPGARSFNLNIQHGRLSKDTLQHNADSTVSRNAAYYSPASGFSEVKTLRTADEKALRRQAAIADSASGSIRDESTEHSGLVSSKESTQDEYSKSASSDDIDQKSHASQSQDVSLGIEDSSPKEDCQDDEQTGQKDPNDGTSSPNNGKGSDSTSESQSTVDSTTDQNTSTNTPTEDCSDVEETQESEPKDKTSNPSNGEEARRTSSTTLPRTEDSNLHQDTSPNAPQKDSKEECEDSTTTSGGSSSETSNGSQEGEVATSEECEEIPETNDVVTSTAATPSKKPPKRPADENASSGSIGGGTAEDAQDFSGISGEENPGDLTNVRWKR